jgi:hypothetical protein
LLAVFSLYSHGHIRLASSISLVALDDIDYHEDLIRMSHKYAKSQYTPSNQRARWAKLAGQLIWYQDNIMKNFSLEAMYIELQEVKKRLIESTERQSQNRNYPLIGLRKVGDRKTEEEKKADDGMSSKTVEEKVSETAE